MLFFANFQHRGAEHKAVIKEARLHTAIHSPLRLLERPSEVIGQFPQAVIDVDWHICHKVVCWST